MIGYFFVKDRDRKFAIRLLILGIALTVLEAITGSIVTAPFGPFFGNVIRSIILTSQLSKTFAPPTSLSGGAPECINGVIYITYRNFGTTPAEILGKFYLDNSEIEPSGCSRMVQPNSTVKCQFGSGLVGNHTLKNVYLSGGSVTSSVTSDVVCV